MTKKVCDIDTLSFLKVEKKEKYDEKTCLPTHMKIQMTKKYFTQFR
jgi:hypothetical protein